jgi:hypothetical protein
MSFTRRLIAITFACAVGGTAHATAMLPLDLPTLCTRADHIVLASVESTHARWTDAHDAIYTDVTLRVTRVYKGTLQPGGAMVVRREGGSVDGIAMRVFGAADFQPGEEAVVFLERRGAAHYVVGMAQGKLHVSLDAQGRKQVAADLSGIALVRPADGRATAPGTARLRLLEELEREIQANARKTGGR